MSKSYDEIFEYIQGLQIIDTHEHLAEETTLPENPDVLATYLYHYFRVDVFSAGLGWQNFAKVTDPRIPLVCRAAQVALETRAGIYRWKIELFVGDDQVAARRMGGLDRCDGGLPAKLDAGDLFIGPAKAEAFVRAQLQAVQPPK